MKKCKKKSASKNAIEKKNKNAKNMQILEAIWKCAHVHFWEGPRSSKIEKNEKTIKKTRGTCKKTCEKHVKNAKNMQILELCIFCTFGGPPVRAPKFKTLQKLEENAKQNANSGTAHVLQKKSRSCIFVCIFDCFFFFHFSGPRLLGLHFLGALFFACFFILIKFYNL